MMQLSEVRDSIHEVSVQLPVESVTNTLVHELAERVRASKGDTVFRVYIYDNEARVSLNLFSKSYKVSLSRDLVGYLEENEIKYSIA